MKPIRSQHFLFVVTAALLASSISAPSGAQVDSQLDLSGNWAAENSTTEGMDAPDEPLPGDWLGIPLNASGRAQALMYSPGQLSEPALTCDYNPVYMMLGPFGLRIWNETEPTTGTTIAWHIGGWGDKPPTTIWVDGRPQLSDYAPHPKGGYATGVWVNGMLQATVTHMQAGITKRNGAPLSDRATMTLLFMRHGDELTVLARIVDPVYLSQPFLITRTFLHYVSKPQRTVGDPCIPSFEGVSETQVPFTVPGDTSLLHIVPDTYGIPTQAAMGGAETMYPEYRDRLKGTYRRPASCQDELKYQTFPDQVCGGPGKWRRRGPNPGNFR